MSALLKRLLHPALLLPALLALAAFAIACDWYFAEPPEALRRATYVGRNSCVACHQAETDAWTGSDHDRAMEVADDRSVLGDFGDVEFTRFGLTTRFFRDGSRYMVSAEGPDGELHDYEVKYTFGVDPLQQYMVEFPGGRLQVLRESWDVREKRWFFVAPPDAQDERIEPGDPLHWTGLAQNWNTMCAECHSTDYHKNFDLASGEYHSQFSEIDVSCEACHGPGSLHVELASRRSLFWDRNVGYGLTNVLKGSSSQRLIETCAPCHSRRVQVHADYRAGDEFLNRFDLVLLLGGLYYGDGQIQDEVYEYGSFLQSKMYAKGVRCTDCHNPHAGDVKLPGNRLCGQCHQPGKYDGPAHHHHDKSAAGSPETLCTSCHMPTRTYMGIDARHDHAIRVPRPDLTVSLGTPNACNQCHDKLAEDAAWAAEAVRRWYGPKRPDDPHFAAALSPAQNAAPGGDEQVAKLLERQTAPDVVRATVVELLAAYDTPLSWKLRREALADENPLVRAAAVRGLGQLSAADLIADVAPRLEDRSLVVRNAAASRLVASAEQLAKTAYRSALDAAVAEYRATQLVSFDRAASHMNLAHLEQSLGASDKAVEELRTAIRLEPYLTGPRSELAGILERRADPAAVKEEVRRLRTEEADLLARDAALLPHDPLPVYRRGMLLYLLGDLDGASEALTESVRRAPEDYQALTALALIFEKQSRWEEAYAVLKKMSDLRPKADDWKGIYLRIRQTREQQSPQEEKPAGEKNP